MLPSFLTPPASVCLPVHCHTGSPVLLLGPQTLKSPPTHIKQNRDVKTPSCEGGTDPGAVHTAECPIYENKGARVESPSQEACHHPSSSVAF